MRARVAAAALLGALTVHVGAAEPIVPVEVRQVAPVPARDATHALTLHLQSFRGTRWTPDEIVAAVAAAGRVLSQCGVALATSELRILQAPARFHYYETAVSRELVRRVATRKPAVFFVEDTRNAPAYDAEAIGLSNAQSRPELANTVWIAHGARDLSLALAHELVHVLTDSGEHSNAPGNLMQPETSPANTHLDRAQCERLRQRGEANGLLRRVR